MVLQNSGTNQSDDDHSFELIDSDDLHTVKSDHTDNESFEIISSSSFEIIGSEELDSRTKDMEELDFTGNYYEVSDLENTLKNDEQDLDDTSDSEQSVYSEQSFSGESTDLGNAIALIEVDNEYGRFLRASVMYGTPEINLLHDFIANIKQRKDTEIKDIAKVHVLPFLPAKSLVRFRSVSKEWDKWIAHPFLAHRQSCCFQDFSGFFCQDRICHFFVPLDWSAYGMPSGAFLFLPQSVSIRSSCNGLLLCQGAEDKSVYYVCNPVNEEYHVLPHSSYYHGEEPRFVLAFEPSVLNCGEDYKVICAFEMLVGPNVCFDIYTSETRSWSCSDMFCSDIEISELKDNGLYQNGVAYWATWSGQLLAFDTKNDVCGVQPVCSEFKGEGTLTLLDGELSYIQSCIEHSFRQADNVKHECRIEIFGGVTMSLKRHLVVEVALHIGDPQSFKVLFAVNSNLFIFSIENMLYSFDVKKKKIELIRRNGITSATTFFPYVNSLVSLPAGSHRAALNEQEAASLLV